MGRAARMLGLLLCLWAPGLSALAASSDVPVLATVAQWGMDSGQAAIIVPLANALSDKQKSIITGGFTTVSQLSAHMAPPNLPEGRFPDEEDAGTSELYKIRCSVKFDAWEETYDVARLDDRPRVGIVKDFAAYANMCLTASLRINELRDQAAAQRLERYGGTLLAYLVVKQTSADEAKRIKDWLIQQQSGVMQGLFSHMLGELTLNQTVKVRITVPPRPDRSPGERKS